MEDKLKYIVEEIISMAMELSYTNAWHVFVEFSGHVNTLDCIVRWPTTDYNETPLKNPEFKAYVRLYGNPNAERELNEIANHLEGLVNAEAA